MKISCFLLSLLLNVVWVFAQAPTDYTNLLKKNTNSFCIASNRNSEENQIEVLKLSTYSQELKPIFIRGSFSVLNYPDLKFAEIKVYNASDDKLIGIFNSNQFTGKYLLILAPNIKYLFQIKFGIYETIEQIVEVPLKVVYEICKQEITVSIHDTKKPTVKINNWFSDGNATFFRLPMHEDLEQDKFINYQAPLAFSNPIKEPVTSINELVKKQIEIEEKRPIEAKTAFNNKDFITAGALYAQLLQNDSGEPFLNYYYGICLLNTEKRKSKAITFLQNATLAKEIPYDVWFHLGNAYHLSCMFKDAQSSYEQFEKKCSNEEGLKTNIDLLIKNCESGNKLFAEQNSIEIESRTYIDNSRLLTYYNSQLINERIKYKTEFFISPLDKKKKEKLLMCSNGNSETIQVSYGLTGNSKKDLYKNALMQDGSYGQSEALETLNTPYDEDYPFITENGKTLYFSSKGHNSMGGYDIFKCTRNSITSSWSAPVNLGYPINSPFDDILFVTDSIGEFASFSSNRRDQNQFEYINIKLLKNTLPVFIIKGHFTTLDSLNSRDAIITIFDNESGEMAGICRTNSVSGNYLMALNPNKEYELTVSCIYYPEFSAILIIPEKTSDFIFRQEIRVLIENDEVVLKINNFFTEESAASLPAEYPLSKHEISAKKVIVSVSSKPIRTNEQQIKDKEMIKKAISFTQQGKFIEAVEIFTELEWIMDIQGTDAYYFGLSLFNTRKDKVLCSQYFEKAATISSSPEDVFYYLGKSYYYSYRFSKAITAYEIFKKTAKAVDIEKLKINEEIVFCENGKKHVDNPSVIEVIKRHTVSFDHIIKIYSDIESGAKVLVIPEDIKSNNDKKKNYQSTLFLSPDKTHILFSSYGESDNKDIFSLRKLPNGEWSIPFKLDVINTIYDEEFPFLSVDGKSLFFSSKGHETMGGFDIFKSDWDELNSSWKKPVNLGVPLNSPFDDLLYIECSK
ncbi:MAG: PD40 domain-containing protein [Bacteroidetes bacterium]|nr:PD40 domain-containing protein [Bacteroidota bacterium]HET6245859.1 hypothetical protein [Bacteroidia bacterium]